MCLAFNALTIHRVADKRVSDTGHMNAYLVGAAVPYAYFQKAAPVFFRDSFINRFSRFAIAAGFHFT